MTAALEARMDELARTMMDRALSMSNEEAEVAWRSYRAWGKQFTEHLVFKFSRRWPWVTWHSETRKNGKRWPEDNFPASGAACT